MTRTATVCLAASFAAVVACLAPLRLQAEDEQKPFEIDGYYVEGCTCIAPCPCELTKPMMGCQGVCVFHFDKATYGGVNLDGIGIACGLEVGKWVRLYVDVKDPKQKDAAIAFGKAAFKAFGPIEDVKEAKVEIAGADGKYTAKVDDGKAFTLTTEPVLGGDGKTPLVYSNIKDPVHPVVMQGTTLSCEYKDDKHQFKLKDSNAYFHAKLKVSGKI